MLSLTLCVSAVCLVLLLSRFPAARQEYAAAQAEKASAVLTPQPSHTPQPAPAAAPAPTAEPEHFPVTENFSALPAGTVSKDLGDLILVYESEGAARLYAHGESVLLYEGSLGGGSYNYLVSGSSFTYIEPENETLRVINLDCLSDSPREVYPDKINGVKSFAMSESGNEFLFEREEPSDAGKTLRVLYLFRDGETVRLGGSAGSIEEFSLSPDGKSLIYYAEDEQEEFTERLIMNGGETVIDLGSRDSELQSLSKDMKSALVRNGDVLTLYRTGSEPLVLSSSLYMYEGSRYGLQEIWWTEQDGSYRYFDGTKTETITGNATAMRISGTGAYAFFRDGAFWAMYQGCEPVRLLDKDFFRGASFLDDGRTLVFDLSGSPLFLNGDIDIEGILSHTEYAVTVDESGVSEPVLLAENVYQHLPFRDGWIQVRTRDASLCDIYYQDRLLGTDVRFWNGSCFDIDSGREILFFVSGSLLYRFDGSTLSAILEAKDAEALRPFTFLDGGRFLYLDGNVLYYYDGSAFSRILEDVDRFWFACDVESALDNRMIG